MTPEQTKHLSLIRRIKNDPYYGRAIKKCGTCGGDGFVTETRFVGSEQRVTHVTCPRCGGHGTVFREWEVCGECVCKCGADRTGPSAEAHDTACPARLDCETCGNHGRVPDEEGREVIAAAVCGWVLTKAHFAPSSPWFDDFKNCRGDYDNDAPLQKWSSRHGQPWQPDIEDAVFNYESPPPDLLTLRDCEWLKGVLREAGYDVQITLESDGDCHAVLLHKGDIVGGGQYADTEAAALLAACEAAWPEKGAGE